MSNRMFILASANTYDRSAPGLPPASNSSDSRAGCCSASSAAPKTVDSSGCCAGPAPAFIDACCVQDADAKAEGEEGCGCGQ